MKLKTKIKFRILTLPLMDVQIVNLQKQRVIQLVEGLHLMLEPELVFKTHQSKLLKI